jgi:hypothetical protein
MLTHVQNCLDRLRRVQYQTFIDLGYMSRDANEIQESGLFDDVSILMEEGRSLIWYLDCI